jgi:SAM-dependent MidA family methyltransferase
MRDALYGPDGFYLRPDAPRRNFRTAAHSGRAWAAAVLGLASLVDNALDRPAEFSVVDVGAGGGELLADLASIAPGRWSLIGVDVAPRPAGLPERVGWQSRPPARATGLIMAIELLDVVPVEVVELCTDGTRYIHVDSAGVETAGAPVGAADLEWLSRWWPLTEVGSRAEIGSTRDTMWRDIGRTLETGLALLVDYAADPRRDVAGTLTGYRDGRQVAPVPDGSMDLTADVLMGSLTDPDDIVLAQREALHRLGVTPRREQYAGDVAGYLEGLSAAGEATELLDPGGLGGFTWLLRFAGCAELSRTLTGTPVATDSK